eukprot:scaffold288006_cov33-Tisochrysis_lutea.AAC.1
MRVVMLFCDFVADVFAMSGAPYSTFHMVGHTSAQSTLISLIGCLLARPWSQPPPTTARRGARETVVRQNQPRREGCRLKKPPFNILVAHVALEFT